MKKCLILIIFATTLLASCTQYNSSSSQRLPMGIVHLRVLREDGVAFKKEDANRFLVDYFDDTVITKIKTHPNDQNELIFICTDMINIYRAKDKLNDNDIKKSLDTRFWFALKDKNGEYKTVRKSYIDCYKKHINNPEKKEHFTWCDYIYQCEIKLERKQ